MCGREWVRTELGPNDADEARIGAVGDSARGKRFARAGGSVEQHPLRRVDAQLHEALRMEHRQLKHLYAMDQQQRCAGRASRD